MDASGLGGVVVEGGVQFCTCNKTTVRNMVSFFLLGVGYVISNSLEVYHDDKF